MRSSAGVYRLHTDVAAFYRRPVALLLTAGALSLSASGHRRGWAGGGDACIVVLPSSPSMLLCILRASSLCWRKQTRTGWRVGRNGVPPSHAILLLFAPCTLSLLLPAYMRLLLLFLPVLYFLPTLPVSLYKGRFTLAGVLLLRAMVVPWVSGRVLRFMV